MKRAAETVFADEYEHLRYMTLVKEMRDLIEGVSVVQLDAFCLKEGKRCIMWDDEGSGFFLV